MDAPAQQPPTKKRRFDELEHDVVTDVSPTRDIQLPAFVKEDDVLMLKAVIALALLLAEDTRHLPPTIDLHRVNPQPTWVVRDFVSERLPNAMAGQGPPGYYEITMSFGPAAQFQYRALRLIIDVNEQRIRNLIITPDWTTQRTVVQFIVYSKTAALPPGLLEMMLCIVRNQPSNASHALRPVPEAAPRPLFGGFFGGGGGGGGSRGNY